MKTGAVYVYTGICLMILGGLWIYFFMNYNGYWFTFSTFEKAISIFSILGSFILIGIGNNKLDKEIKKKEEETKEKTKDVLNKF
jgi:putative Mn2+ efflux pump MntP